MTNSPLTIRFRKWPGPVGPEGLFFKKLFEVVTQKEIEIVDSIDGDVDIEIESVYGERQIPSFNSRLHRFIGSHLPPTNSRVVLVA